MADLIVKPQSAEDFVRMLLWDDFPECCGRPVVGAEYMGQKELVCCGCPEPALLSDAQIVASLRSRFPDTAGAPSSDRQTPAANTKPASEPVQDENTPFPMNVYLRDAEELALFVQQNSSTQPVQDAASVEGLMKLVSLYGRYKSELCHSAAVETCKDIRAYAQRLKEGK